MTDTYALVTGASSGIGRAICHDFAKNNHDLIIVARSKQALHELKTELEKEYKIAVVVIAADLSKADDVETLCARIEQAGLLVGQLVNNAGFGEFGPVIKTDWNRLNQMIQLNMTALTRLSAHFAALMVARGSGRILNVASTAAFVSGPGMAVYFATKAYVLSFSEGLGEELRGSGVTVTALCPGPTQSGFATAAHAEKSGIFRGKLPSSAEVSSFGYRAMQAGKPVVIHGVRNRMMILVTRLVPRQLIVKSMSRMQLK